MTRIIDAINRLRKTALASESLYIAYAIYLMKFILENSTLDQVASFSVDGIGVVVDCLVLCLLFVRFISQGFGPRLLLLSFCLVAIAFLVWRTSAEGWLFWLALFVICTENADYVKLSKVTYKVCFSCVVVVAALSLAGVIPDVVAYRGEIRRTSLGFEHPNQLGLYLILIATSYSAASMDARMFKSLFVIILAIVANWLTCDSRTLTYLLVFQIVLLTIFRYIRKDRDRRVVLVMLSALVVFLVVTSLYFLFCFDGENRVHELIDTALSGRFYLANKFYSLAGLSMFGCDYTAVPDVPWVGGERFSFLVDNGYLHCLQRFGVVPFTMLCAALIALFTAIVKRCRWDGCVFGLFVLLIYAFTETGGLRAENLYLVVGFASIWYSTSAASSKRAENGINGDRDK